MKNEKILDSSCPLNKCSNGGQCSTKLKGKFHCECLFGFNGAICENG